MLHDNQSGERWVIGYDLRVIRRGSDAGFRASLDPTIWPSARDLAEYLITQCYDVDTVTDISNGINLINIAPKCPAPQGFCWAAFDASRSIIEYMCSSFGLQRSMFLDWHVLVAEKFSFLGYDIVDLWTQASALLQLENLRLKEIKVNRWSLLDTSELASQALDLANEMMPELQPFHPVGVWIREGPGIIRNKRGQTIMALS